MEGPIQTSQNLSYWVNLYNRCSLFQYSPCADLHSTNLQCFAVLHEMDSSGYIPPLIEVLYRITLTGSLEFPLHQVSRSPLICLQFQLFLRVLSPSILHVPDLSCSHPKSPFCLIPTSIQPCLFYFPLRLRIICHAAAYSLLLSYSVSVDCSMIIFCLRLIYTYK